MKMSRDYRYDYVQCPKCKKWVTLVWLVRHTKAGCTKGGKEKNPDASLLER